MNISTLYNWIDYMMIEKTISESVQHRFSSDEIYKIFLYMACWYLWLIIWLHLLRLPFIIFGDESFFEFLPSSLSSSSYNFVGPPFLNIPWSWLQQNILIHSPENFNMRNMSLWYTKIKIYGKQHNCHSTNHYHIP